MPMPEPAKRAVVLANLGTPDSPAVDDVRRYLGEFLSDRRIVDAPRAFWLPFLHLVLLRFYAPKSAARYASVWTPNGSPLRVNMERQVDGLQRRLGEDVAVRYAMRYGSPSLASTLEDLRSEGVDDVTLLSAFPQASTTTTDSLHDAFAAQGLRVTWIDRWGDDEGYIAACAARILAFWDANGRPDFAAGDRLLLSFHGVPMKAVGGGDAYPSECEGTAARLRESLGLDPRECQLTYQSRFGPAKWLGPATIATVRELGRAGTRRVDVFCPGFTADCLETLEEIGHQNRSAFQAAGGGVLNLIESLNDEPQFLDALAALVRPVVGDRPQPIG